MKIESKEQIKLFEIGATRSHFINSHENIHISWIAIDDRYTTEQRMVLS